MIRIATPTRTRTIAVIAMVGVFGGYALSLAGGASAVSAADAPHKAFVCKYVGTPGTNERLQTGNNPISVGFGKDPIVVGSYINDSQGRSYVLALDSGQPKPDVSQCPRPVEPTPSVEPSVEPTPSVEPSVEPTPSVEPSVEPTQNADPTPSVDPSSDPAGDDPSVEPTETNGPPGDVAGLQETAQPTLPPTDTVPATGSATSDQGTLVAALLILVSVVATTVLVARRPAVSRR